ncbi:alpha/beta hydrolase [Salipaludibacillus agaradhaerens]|jgi:pimeloyl-ACP methyl ester carboxylesterase|uniref:alpha/beta fold hydrolase n=1 Tax=Salipaludibacillus agaradhaerens TaxID=76935 RepID=UPI002150E014|nr:alpha/beta hydrolase [Salipaludibacillus agaradhaerens]MCR6105543.1 alpha/beta hydrolase [Salipaludibacillus agaradhaerens]MCR6117580.1 alpha/beta hydrolase [Salipaludibacillus agaradhaerens]
MSIQYKTINIHNVNIFYREAGNRSNPTILLLHGFPSSSHMYRDLIIKLMDDYHIIAPDYPGFGNSGQPGMDDFDYTFDNIAMLMNEFVETLNLEKYSIYVHDYGAPIGFRLATNHPERIEAVITQNGNAYEEGLLSAWDPIRRYWENPTEENKNKLRSLLSVEFTKYQYTDGTRHPERISPDAWNMDQLVLDRPGNDDIQLALYYDYRNNLIQYPDWHDFFRTYQPSTLVVWGKNDMFFGPKGALAFQKDLKDCEVHLLNTGHFPLEEELETSAFLIKQFLRERLK